MYETLVGGGQAALADGVIHLSGQAECPCRASVFDVAQEYASANGPSRYACYGDQS